MIVLTIPPMVDTRRGYHLLDFLNTRERIVGDRIKKHRIKRKNIFQNFRRRQHSFKIKEYKNILGEYL